MAEYLAPGVYVEEIEVGGKSIEGVSTSTAGFIGETERGPTNPRLVTGLEHFYRLFGRSHFKVRGKPSNSYLPAAVEGFFLNGGKRCFVTRVVSGAAGQPAALELSKLPGVSDESKEAGLSPGAKDSKDKDKSAPGSGTINKPKNVAVTIKALGPGIWGNLISLEVEAGSLSLPESEAQKGDPQKKLFKCKISYWEKRPPADWHKQSQATREKPILVEIYDNCSVDPKSPDYFEKRINNRSALVRVEGIGDDPPAPFKKDEMKFLDGGNDGNDLILGDYKGGETTDEKTGVRKKTGLVACAEIDEINFMCAPNEGDITGLTGALVAHCENLSDRFTILQAKQAGNSVETLRPPTDSKYAAFYYPWIWTIDKITGNRKLVPPGGHIAGIYARSDIERGVHKAPANEIVRGAIGLQFPLSKGEQEILNPRGVNCIRAFEGRGIRVWGARTISSDPSWKYVNVRRLFLYLEESIDEGTQWVVFEPNNQLLWARVRQTITDFLTRVWRDGALMGTTADEAFFVKCDETTMTQDDIDNGRLIVLVGVAPVKPAEFVVFRICQKRGGAEIEE